MPRTLDYEPTRAKRSWQMEGLPHWATGACGGFIVMVPAVLALMLLSDRGVTRWLFPFPWSFFDANAYFPQIELLFIGLIQFPMEGMLIGLAMQQRRRPLRWLALAVPAAHLVLAWHGG